MVPQTPSSVEVHGSAWPHQSGMTMFLDLPTNLDPLVACRLEGSDGTSKVGKVLPG